MSVIFRAVLLVLLALYFTGCASGYKPLSDPSFESMRATYNPHATFQTDPLFKDVRPFVTKKFLKSKPVDDVIFVEIEPKR